MTDNVLFKDISVGNLLHPGYFCAPLESCGNVNGIIPSNLPVNLINLLELRPAWVVFLYSHADRNSAR